MEKEKQIIITLCGGLVDDIITNFDTEKLKVLVVDYDTDGAEAEDLYKIPTHLSNIEHSDCVYIHSHDAQQNVPWVQNIFQIFNYEDYTKKEEPTV